MADIYNSCPNCTNLRLLLEERISEIEKLQTQIKSLNKVLQCYKVRICKNCNKDMESEISQKYEMDTSKTASSVHLKSQIKGIISFNSCETENSEFLNLKQKSFNLENSNIMKSSEETENLELYNSTPVNEQKSSEEYIYDENYMMYYCISTGYYYDRNTGLYYVPQNGAYYTYDYTENAYVLYDGEKSAANPNGNKNIQQELKSSTVGTDDVVKDIDGDINKTDDSCESVVDQVNKLNIGDTIAGIHEINVHQTVEDQTDGICESNKQEAEHKLELQENETCSKDWQTPAGTNLTVQDLVREVAEQHSGMSDYIYDENSRMYYSPSTGYYYDAVKNLLYDPQSGIYYKYDQDTCSYEFYHQIDLTDVAVSKSIKKKEQIESRKVKARRKYWRKKQDNTPEKCSKSITQLEEDILEKESDLQNENYSSPEEGELFSSDSEEEIESQSQVLPYIEDSSSVCSPCIRAIVKNSEKLKTGTLILITCTGAVIGRDKCNAVFIPDSGVSKAHAEVRFIDELWKYSIKDLGSQNGTFVNDARLSQPKEESQPHILNHGDNISVGSCQLVFHIHVGYETCDECEPGQIMAELSLKEEKITSVFKTKEEKEKERRQAVRRLKKKYGLEGMGYETNKNSVLPPDSGYEDKAEIRRKTVGSENPHEKTETSLMEGMMSESNKGYQMLKKLGWKEGDSLGLAGAGILEPIPLRPWLTKAGLGSSEEQKVCMQNLPEDRRKRKWIKARERFFQLS